MKNTYFITLLAIVGLAFVGCKVTDKSAVDDSEEAGDMGAAKVGIYDSRAIAFAYWSQDVDGKQR